MLAEGTKAPDFTLNDKDGKPVSLSDFRGKKVVVYFYPKDNTPGCTREACVFKEAYDGFKADDIAVIGISKDSSQSHQKFAEKYELPFILLSDPDLTAIKAYDVWKEKKRIHIKNKKSLYRGFFYLVKLEVSLQKFLSDRSGRGNVGRSAVYFSKETGCQVFDGTVKRFRSGFSNRWRIFVSHTDGGKFRDRSLFLYFNKDYILK